MIRTTCDTCDVEKAEESAKQERGERERQRQRGLEEANIPRRYRETDLTNFVTSSVEQRVAVQLVQDFVSQTNDAPANSVGLLFIGGVGTGKTHLACAALRKVIQKPGDGLYLTFLKAIRQIKHSWTKGSSMSEQQAFNYLARPGLLVLDEVGVQHGSETERMLLTEIVNDRYADEKPTILISNLTMLEFTQVVGERVVDRFKEGGRVVVFDWASYRPQKYRIAEGN